jgi:hypothetical protein
MHKALGCIPVPKMDGRMERRKEGREGRRKVQRSSAII